jgi:hypothetical protein
MNSEIYFIWKRLYPSSTRHVGSIIIRSMFRFSSQGTVAIEILQPSAIFSSGVALLDLFTEI